MRLKWRVNLYPPVCAAAMALAPTLLRYRLQEASPVLAHAIFALAAAMSLGEVAALSEEIEDEAASLAMQEEVTPDFLARLEDFSADAYRLSEALRASGVIGELPVVIDAIAVDALLAHRNFKAAETEAETSAAFDALRLALDDAILLAPLAASAVADADAPNDVAAR